MPMLISQYGEAIAKRYMIKYTLKYWGIDASGLSLSWIGNRIRKADVSEILRGAFELRDDNHYYADEMRYPRKGGYVSFIKPMLERVNVSLNKKAILVSLKNKLIQFHDGETVVYDRLINTMPLPELIKIIDDVPSSIKSAADSLLYTKINLISVGFSKLINNKYLWFYMYSDTLAARAHSPSLKSSDSAPDGCSSLQFDIYHLSTSEQVSVDDMKADVKKYLINSEICQEGDILFLHHEYIEYGNIVYDHGMEERREIVLNYLKENSIFTAGRFGEWSYLWSDQALISGKLAASNILAELDCC